MTKPKAEKNQAKPENADVEGKLQDYHRKGGAQGDSNPAKDLEGEIGAAAVSQNDELKKGRPRSSDT